MKTIVENATNQSLYLLADTETVAMNETHIVVGDPARFIVGDCNSGNTTLIEGVTEPAEWVGRKYLYTEADGWALNPNYSVE